MNRIALAAPLLLSMFSFVGCSASPAAAPTPTDAVTCPDFNRLYSGTSRQPLFQMVPVGDTLYYPTLAAKGAPLEIDSLTPGGEPQMVISDMGEGARFPFWVIGTSLVWVTSQGVSTMPVAGGNVLVGPQSAISTTQVMTSDATHVYGVTGSVPPVVLSQSIAPGTTETAKTLATLPPLPSSARLDRMYDGGDVLFIDGTVSDPTSGYVVGALLYQVSKGTGEVIQVTLPPSIDFLVALAGTSGFLAQAGEGDLATYSLDGKVSSHWPTNLPPFFTSEGAAAMSSDGTVYASGQLAEANDMEQGAFTVAHPDGSTSILACGAPMSATSLTGALADDFIAIGQSAVYGVIIESGTWSLVSFPK